MKHNTWFRFIATFALGLFVLGLFVLVGSGNAFAQDSIAVSPEVAQTVGEQPANWADLTEKFAKCTADNETCKKNLDEAFPLIQQCRPDCTRAQFDIDRCAKVPFAKNPAGKAFAGNGGKAKVHVVPCESPAYAEGGICKCDDRRVASGGVVTAKIFGVKQGACVPTVKLLDAEVARLRNTQRATCMADGVLTPEKLAEFGIVRQLDPSDPLCDSTGKFIEYLVNWHLEMKRNQLTPENWFLVWQYYQKQANQGKENPITKIADGASAIGDIQEKLADHENRLLKLEQKGWHLQIGASGLYHARFSNGQDTVGALATLNIVDKVSFKNGVLIGFEGGYGVQPRPNSKLGMWGVSLQWYHVLNTEAKSTESDSKVLFATRLGVCAGGGAKVENIQDESYVAACGGIQIMPDPFGLDLGLLVGYDRHGLYKGKERLGYSAISPFLGLRLGGFISIM